MRTLLYSLSLSPLSLPLSLPHSLKRTTYFNHTISYNSDAIAAASGGSGRNRWSGSNSGWVSSSGYGKYFEDEELFGDTNGDDDETMKKRTWWNDNADDDDEEDEDDMWEMGFGEAAIWGFKIIRTFGWMLPAVAVSSLLGTDNSNAFFMALAVPLGQTAISLIIDKVWGSPTNGSKFRSKTKKRKKKKDPFTEAASNARMGRRKDENRTTGGRSSYQSWVGGNGGSYKRTEKRADKFGGWDDLDRDSYKVPKEKHSQEEGSSPKARDKRKLSRMRRVKEEPLLLRLLIAVFPFLGSWTKFLF